MKEPVKVSAQAWRCPCGRVNGIPEVSACACGDWTLNGPVIKGDPSKPSPKGRVLDASGEPFTVTESEFTK